MHVVRTIAWVLLTIALVLFAVANWKPVEVAIGNGLVLETKLAALVIGAFLLGLVPMWIVHRVALWRAHRQMAAIAAAHNAAAFAPGADRQDDPRSPERPHAS